MTIAILGGTGFIGSALVEHLLQDGHRVVLFTRSNRRPSPIPHGVSIVEWPLTEKITHSVDAVINLAGETINQRWTDQAKKKIFKSRIETTRQLASAIENGQIQTQTLINGSAIGYYGHDETKVWTEDDRPLNRPADFLASVVEAWEQEAIQVEKSQVRCIVARFGVVLGCHGGALPKMLAPYQAFIGGCIGQGSQPVSWIHVEDVIGLLLHCLKNAEITGVVNLTSPAPINMNDLGRSIGRIMGRPHWLPVPGWALRLLFGEMSDLLLKGQKVIPKRAIETGYRFKYPTINLALQNLACLNRS